MTNAIAPAVIANPSTDGSVAQYKDVHGLANEGPNTLCTFCEADFLIFNHMTTDPLLRDFACALVPLPEQ